MAWLTRFAPSPTGPLHLGHAFAALTAAACGTMRLRWEDIDPDRCRPAWEAAAEEDLRWLGLDWPQPVWRQSERGPAYAEALARLAALGVVYPCRCRRADLRAALAAPQENGPDGPVYPGTCRGRAMAEAGPDDALRLDARKAVALTGDLSFREFDQTKGAWTTRALPAPGFVQTIGDVVLARRGWGTSYHLAVTVDDAAQGVTLVTRGEDLRDATFIHVALQRLLGLPTPGYLHHRLIRDDAGRRLAKRDDARALATLRAEGWTPGDVRQAIGWDSSTSTPPRMPV